MSESQGKDNQLNVTVVVSGNDVSVKVNLKQKAHVLIGKALEKSGNAGQPPEDWVLKLDTTVIDPERRLDEFGITENSKLYLNPKRGEGGCGCQCCL